MGNIDTSNRELNPYTPQIKSVKQEFLVILPYRETKTDTEIMRPITQNISSFIFNDMNLDNSYTSVTYGYIHFNMNNYFLIPLKRTALPSYYVLFIDEESNNEVGHGSFPSSTIKSIEGSWYILHYILINVTDNEYFTTTEVQLSQDNLPMPYLSAWEPQVTPVPQNTIINAEDDITSYIYTENGWEVFANNTPNITDSETQLFIRGLVYGEDVESHEDDGGEIIGGDEIGGGVIE